jgi:hypothetical protein
MVLRRSIDRLLGGLDSFLEVRHVSSPDISVSESNAKVIQVSWSVGMVLWRIIDELLANLDSFPKIRHGSNPAVSVSE